MQVLTPSGPFLLILWDPVARRCNVKGFPFDNKALMMEVLQRGKQALEEHYDDIAKTNLLQKPKVTLTDA